MLNRDFKKSNKEYFKSNMRILIAIGVFLLVGIIIFSIFGMNGNFEIAGYNEFTVNVNSEIVDKYSKYQREIGDIVDSYGGDFDTVTIYGEGDNSKFVVRYMKDLDETERAEVNALVAEKLELDISAVEAEHIKVSPSVTSKDYVYTATAILLLIVVATIFAYARYNGASGMAMMLACLLGTLGFMSIGAILRLRIGMSYLAMLVILNMLIAYVAINIFESMHKSSWLSSGDYGTAIKTAVNSNKVRLTILTFAILAVGLIFAMFGTSAIKYVSLNIMFMAVILLAVGLYVIPFVWSVFITKSRQREYKIKPSSVETNKK